MYKLTIAAAAIAFGAMLASAPVQAEHAGGGPNHKGNQCFTFSQSMERDGRFGSWSNCPATASTASAAAAHASPAGQARRSTAAR